MNKLTINEINQAIMFGNWDNDQLTSILMSVKYARSQLGRKTKQNLRIGAKVKFVSSRSGQTLFGTVEKIAIKNVTVTTPTGRWRVPANMLEEAA